MSNINRPTFESRIGGCLFSKDDNPKLAFKENHHTVLDPVWTFNYLYKDGQSVKAITKRLLMYPIAYAFGIIGYALEVAMKVILALGNTLAYFRSLHRGDPELKQKRADICLDSWAALGIAMVGTVIPPLAYHLDKKAEETFLKIVSGHKEKHSCDGYTFSITPNGTPKASKERRLSSSDSFVSVLPDGALPWMRPLEGS